MPNDPKASFEPSVALVLGEIKNLKELRQSAYSKRVSFAIDVCLVAHGVRAGYLVDTLCPHDPTETFGALLMALRSKSEAFRPVVFWNHALTTQSFFVHVTLFHNRITALLGGATGECIFIKLDKQLSVSRNPPDALREVLCDMRSVMTEGSPDALVHQLPELCTAEVLIPLAAIVVDYPVAYFPAFPAQPSFLSGEPLDVYTLSIKSSISDFTLGFGNEHVLLKFSCPQVVASNVPELSPSAVIKKLHSRILQRIGASVSVTHGTETLDRVAL